MAIVAGTLTFGTRSTSSVRLIEPIFPLSLLPFCNCSYANIYPWKWKKSVWDWPWSPGILFPPNRIPPSSINKSASSSLRALDQSEKRTDQKAHSGVLKENLNSANATYNFCQSASDIPQESFFNDFFSSGKESAESAKMARNVNVLPRKRHSDRFAPHIE